MMRRELIPTPPHRKKYLGDTARRAPWPVVHPTMPAQHIPPSKRPRTTAPTITCLFEGDGGKTPPRAATARQHDRRTECRPPQLLATVRGLNGERLRVKSLTLSEPRAPKMARAPPTSATTQDRKSQAARIVKGGSHVGLTDASIVLQDKLTRAGHTTHHFGCGGFLEASDSRLHRLGKGRGERKDKDGTASFGEAARQKLNQTLGLPPQHQTHETHVPTPGLRDSAALDLPPGTLHVDNHGAAELPAYETMRRSRCLQNNQAPRAGSRYTFRIGDVF